MPSIEKQSPPRAAVKAAPGSILAEAIAIQDLVTDYIKIAIYGVNRVGKTYIAVKFPKPLLLISFEPGQSGGAKTAKAEQGVSFIHIVNKGEKDHRGIVQKEWASAKAVRLANELRDSCPFKTIVLDTVTSFQDLILQEILDLPQVVDQLNWGMVTEDQYRQRSERTREVLRPFINVPAHTVFLAQMKDHNQIKGDRSTSKMLRGQHSESFFSVDLGGATAKWLQDSCDYITHLFQEKEFKTIPGKPVKVGDKTRPGTPTEVETGRMIRRLRTMFHPNFMAGCRSEVPLNVPEFIEVPQEQEGKKTDIFERIERLVIGVKQQKAASES